MALTQAVVVSMVATAVPSWGRQEQAGDNSQEEVKTPTEG